MEKASSWKKKTRQLSLMVWVVNENKELYLWDKHWRPIDNHLFPYGSPDFKSLIDVCEKL